MIKVLHVVTRLDIGGITTFLYNYYSNLDRSKIHFDIVAIDTGQTHGYHEKFVALGAGVYYMPDAPLARSLFFLRLLKNHDYDVVHSHIEVQSSIYLLLAWFRGIKSRIAHAHLSQKNIGFKNRALKFILNRIVTLRAGASELALNAVFGQKYANKGIIINNAVDLKQFRFDREIRMRYRQNLELNGKLVVGFVGRLTYQKNIPYIVRIFDALSEIEKNAVLLVIGDGEDGDILLSELKKRSLGDKLIWLKSRRDVDRLMMAMDVLVLPSHFEGLPLVLVESQASALHSLVSEKVSRLVDLTSFIHFLPIDDPAINRWAKLIKELGKDESRRSAKVELSNGGFDLKEESKKLLTLYKKELTNAS